MNNQDLDKLVARYAMLPLKATLRQQGGFTQEYEFPVDIFCCPPTIFDDSTLVLYVHKANGLYHQAQYYMIHT